MCGRASQPFFHRTVPDTLRVRVLEEALRRNRALPRDWRYAVCLADMLFETTRRVGPGARHQLAEAALDLAPRLVAAGDTAETWYLLDRLTFADTTQPRRLEDLGWYAELLAARDRVRRQAEERFVPLRARVARGELVLEWRARGEGPFTWNRRATPWGGPEYLWTTTVVVGDRTYLTGLDIWREWREGEAAPPGSGTLAELVRGRSAAATVTERGRFRALSEVRGEVTVSGDTLRIVVRQAELMRALSQTRPAVAAFRFFPCVARRDPDGRCRPVELPIAYQ